MSQDLFAAFGSAPEPASQSHLEVNSSHISPGNTSSTLVGQEIEDEDDFGDFEDANPTASPLERPQKISGTTAQQNNTKVAVQPTQKRQAAAKLPFELKSESITNGKIGRHPFADHMDVLFAADDEDYDAGKDELNDLANNPEAAMAYSKRIIEEQMAAQAKSQHQAQPKPVETTRTSNVVPVNVKPRDPNVLFDAEDMSDEQPEAENEDDWGAFEDTTTARQTIVQSKPKPTTPSLDLLDLDDRSPAPAPTNTKEAVPSAPKTSIQSFKQSTSTKAKNTINVLADSDEPWDDFDDAPPAASVQASNKPNPAVSAITLTQPPTNIPPPSVLLSYFGTTLKSLPSPNSLEEFVESMVVLAHVLAGRKYRWKRSTILASSMRIGPAAAGGKSGMKLAGVDRSEVTREDREVAEIFTNWRRQVGKLRAAFTTTKSLRLPELQETLPVKPLKALDGGFTAPHECALCGLRRDERVAKIDDQVQDSFGEWWVDAISMHTLCGKWWSRNEPAMRGR